MMQILKLLSVLFLVFEMIGCREAGIKEPPQSDTSSDLPQTQPPLDNLAVAPKRELQLPRIGADTGSKLKIGDKFPDLRCIDLDGNEIAFDRDILGDRYTLVVFWSTWCGFCMLELPHEIELGERYSSIGLRIIGINADATMEEGKAAAVKNHVTWLNFYEGNEHWISDELGIGSWPCLFLLDATGTVVSSSEQMRRQTILEMSDGSLQQKSYLDWTLETVFASVKPNG